MIVTLSPPFSKWCLHCLCYEPGFVRFSRWYSCVSSLQFSNSSPSALYHSRSLSQLCHFTWYCSCFPCSKCLEFWISSTFHSSWSFTTIGGEGVCFCPGSGSGAAFKEGLGETRCESTLSLGVSAETRQRRQLMRRQRQLMRQQRQLNWIKSTHVCKMEYWCTQCAGCTLYHSCCRAGTLVSRFSER